MEERKCKVCNNILDGAEMYREESICDLCTIKRSRQRDIESTKEEKLSMIPEEYRDCRAAMDAIYKRYNTNIGMFQKSNLYVSGDKHGVTKLGWSVYRELWENGRFARMISMTSWYAKYKANASERWDMMVDMADYDGVAILNVDSLYGIDDQSVLYSLLQLREDRGSKTCVLHNISSGDLLSPMLSSFLNDETSNYIRISLSSKKT